MNYLKEKIILLKKKLERPFQYVEYVVSYVENYAEYANQSRYAKYVHHVNMQNMRIYEMIKNYMTRISVHVWQCTITLHSWKPICPIMTPICRICKSICTICPMYPCHIYYTGSMHNTLWQSPLRPQVQVQCCQADSNPFPKPDENASRYAGIYARWHAFLFCWLERFLMSHHDKSRWERDQLVRVYAHWPQQAVKMPVQERTSANWELLRTT